MQYSDLIEKKRHGTPYFPVEYYYIDKTHPRYVMSLHWHKEFEIIKVLRGRFTVYLNSVPHEMREGDCLFVEGGCLKRGEPHDCIYECLVFDASMLSRINDCILDPNGKDVKYKNPIDRENSDLTSTVDELLRSTREAGNFYELEAVGLLYKLFFHLYQSGNIVKKQSAESDKRLHTVMKVLEWIERNNSERITLADVSTLTGLTEKYICRIFKEYTSKTVMEYVNESRIEKACALLSSESVTQAAFDCGFNDLSYFCKMFKKYKGISPSEYANMKDFKRDG